MILCLGSHCLHDGLRCVTRNLQPLKDRTHLIPLTVPMIEVLLWDEVRLVIQWVRCFLSGHHVEIEVLLEEGREGYEKAVNEPTCAEQ